MLVSNLLRLSLLFRGLKNIEAVHNNGLKLDWAVQVTGLTLKTWLKVYCAVPLISFRLSLLSQGLKSTEAVDNNGLNLNWTVHITGLTLKTFLTLYWTVPLIS